MADFEIPDFLQHGSTEEIHERMIALLPADIDISAGGHPWNFTIAPALVISELYEFVLPELLMLASPQTAYDEFLDTYAKDRGLTRKEATAAIGEITITGTANTVIPPGTVFSTAAVNDEPSVDYITLEAATIPESGSVTIPIECTQTGIIGNTAANTIVLVSGRISGVSSVTNTEGLTGGTEEEDDESLQQRIAEYDQSQSDSYVGSPADYKRWATSVPGVGSATIIPAQDTSGLVTIILTDANGEPATQQLCDAVYNYIMRPDDPYERLAPINAYIKVDPPATMQIGIQATVELEEGATLESVKTAYMARLALYLPEALDDGEIKYTRVAAALAATEGANDFSGLQIGLKAGGAVNYGTSNIPITSTQLPTIDPTDLVLTSGTV